ncbi:RNA polymerase sigma factor [bacterium]|nr:RNA polymerase sigma factor [bacterium]
MNDIMTLVNQALEGDVQAIEQIYNQFYPSVHRQVWNLVPKEYVDDVTQEVFISVIHSLINFRGDSKFTTWLYTITRREVANFYRKQNRLPSQISQEIGEFEEILSSSAARNNPKIQDDLITLRHCIAQLPDNYQEVILLRLVEEKKFRTIAAEMHKSLEATKSLFRRAMEALRVELSHD